jgi:hypothetical protein
MLAITRRIVCASVFRSTHAIHHSRFASVAIRTPKVGKSIQHGELTNWLVPIGAHVIRDDTLLMQYKTAHDRIDIMAPATGRLAEQLAAKNQRVNVDVVIGTIDTSSEPLPAITATPTYTHRQRCQYPLCRPDYSTHSLDRSCCGLQQAMDACCAGQRVHRRSLKFKCWPEGHITCKCPIVQALAGRKQ